MPKQRVQAKVILLNENGEVLLLKRSQYSDRRAGEWELIGGGVERGESPEKAASREIQEEAGLTVPITTQDLVYAQTRVPSHSEVNVTWITYVGHVAHADVHLSEEHTEYQWVSVQTALGTLTYDIQLNALKHAAEHGFLA